MFAKLAVFVVATMAVFVSAAPAGEIQNSCNAGEVQCCNSLYEEDSFDGKRLQDIFHFDAPINTKIGAQCSPISVLAIGKGASCSSQPVCCSNNSFNGVIAWGCSPVNVNL